ncbi:MAG: ATP-binding cassette domain-containing protein, partial [Pseudomonadota bacterium]
EVSLTVAPGEVLAVIGPNGAGKSTLLACLTGAIAPERGEVRMDATPLSALGPADLACRRAVLEQSPSIAVPLEVRDVIGLGLPLQISPRRRDQIVIEVAGAMGLTGFLDRRGTALSGGEAHRMHMARVLAQLEAGRDLGFGRWLFLDEPTASLDLGHQDAVLRAARDAASAGAGVVVVMHDLSLAAALADRLVLLDRGRIRALGRPSEVLTPALLGETYGIEIAVSEPHPGLTAITPIFSRPKPGEPRCLSP